MAFRVTLINDRRIDSRSTETLTSPLTGSRRTLPSAASASRRPSTSFAKVPRSTSFRLSETVALPLPVTPAARVVLGVQPLTGCVFRSPAEVDALDDERGGAGFEGRVAAWCLGRATADRARERGWQRVEPVDKGVDVAKLVERIKESRASAG